jgi:hypothetical protein
VYTLYPRSIEKIVSKIIAKICTFFLTESTPFVTLNLIHLGAFTFAGIDDGPDFLPPLEPACIPVAELGCAKAFFVEAFLFFFLVGTWLTIAIIPLISPVTSRNTLYSMAPEESVFVPG